MVSHLPISAFHRQNSSPSSNSGLKTSDALDVFFSVIVPNAAFLQGFQWKKLGSCLSTCRLHGLSKEEVNAPFWALKYYCASHPFSRTAHQETPSQTTCGSQRGSECLVVGLRGEDVSNSKAASTLDWSHQWLCSVTLEGSLTWWPQFTDFSTEALSKV